MNHILKYLLIVVACEFLSVASFSQTLDSLNAPSKIYGKITGNNKPLNGANVVIENSIDGATSDSSGYYEFETSKLGKQRLLFTAVEYKEKTQEVNIEAGKSFEINVTLSESEVVTEEIIVTASSFTSGEQSKVTLTPLEIVRIPGADADLYRAITTFPGTNQVDEGSRIAVRGGDASEVLTVLDLLLSTIRSYSTMILIPRRTLPSIPGA